MSVSLEEVRHVAALARIALDETEVSRYAHELSAIVGYVDRLQQVDTSFVEDGAVFSDMLPPDHDTTRTSPEEREQLIQLFPDRLSDLLRVPSVFPRRSVPNA